MDFDHDKSAAVMNRHAAKHTTPRRPWWLPYQWQVNTICRYGPRMLHVEIWRRDGKEIRLSWSRMSALLREAFPELDDETFVEFYPAARYVVDEVNRRHFWALPTTADWARTGPLYRGSA